jgi:hypothetical protein
VESTGRFADDEERGQRVTRSLRRRTGIVFAPIRYARDRLGLLRDGDVMDWEADVWDLRRALGVRWDIEAGRRIRFDRIPQPWLRDRAKRWAQLRLASRSQRYVDSNIRKVVILGEFLAVHDYGSTPVTLRREHLEHFVAWLPSTGLARNTLAGVVTAISHVLRRLCDARLERRHEPERSTRARRRPRLRHRSAPVHQRRRDGTARRPGQHRPVH